MPDPIVPGDCVQVNVALSRRHVELYSSFEPPRPSYANRNVPSCGKMDVHDTGLVIATTKSDQTDWCLIVCRSFMGWTLRVLLDKVPRE